MRKLNNIATRIISNPNHPIRPYCLNPTKLDEYALRPAIPKPLFVRAMELLEKLLIDTRKIERSPQYFRPPWTNIDHKRFDYELCAIRRGASNDSKLKLFAFPTKSTKITVVHTKRKHNKKKTISTKLDLQR
jgi:hypothetical protein